MRHSEEPCGMQMLARLGPHGPVNVAAIII